MRQGAWGWALLASACASAAQASDKPVYAPAPAWVKAAPPIDAAKLDDASPILVLLDNQQRIAGGEVWSYTDTATRIASAEVLGQAGTIGIPWNPAKGDLLIHKAEILRGGERIDLLAGGKQLTVLRREQQLEQAWMDGMLTATMAVEGLRIGDVLHVVASVTTKETAFGTSAQAVAAVPVAPFRVGFARARLLWPKAEDVRWRTYADGAQPVVATVGDLKEVTLSGTFPKPEDLPDDAPIRYRKLPIVEATTFADWQAVSRVSAPLYATLDAALKDCTKAIALSGNSAAPLDSRALVYWRMNKPQDALADLAAALEQAPEQASSLYLRGVIRSRQGDAMGAKADLVAARTRAPRIDEQYKRYGIVP